MNPHTNPEDDRLYEAIANGVERAIRDMIWHDTTAPGDAFYATICKAAERAFGEIVTNCTACKRGKK